MTCCMENKSKPVATRMNLKGLGHLSPDPLNPKLIAIFVNMSTNVNFSWWLLDTMLCLLKALSQQQALLNLCQTKGWWVEMNIKVSQPDILIQFWRWKSWLICKLLITKTMQKLQWSASIFFSMQHVKLLHRKKALNEVHTCESSDRQPLVYLTAADACQNVLADWELNEVFHCVVLVFALHSMCFCNEMQSGVPTMKVDPHSKN